MLILLAHSSRFDASGPGNSAGESADFAHPTVKVGLVDLPIELGDPGEVACLQSFEKV
jgi:hypothetical protein